MRQYNPYSLISDMRGLGAGEARFVAPAVIPNPSKSESSAREFMRIWIAWAADRELLLRDWAGDIDSLIANKAATCEALREYNDAAIAHYVEEVKMGQRFILGGVKESDLPPPFFPLVFASSTRIKSIDFEFIDWPTGRVTIEYDLPCGTNGQFPDFAAMRSFGDPRDVSGALTPPGGAQLGLAQLPVWAIVALTTIVVGGTLLLVNMFRDWTRTQQLEVEKQLRSQDAAQDKERASANARCVDLAVAKFPDMTPEELSRIRAECVLEANKLFPPLRAISSSSLGTSILLGGLGVAAVVGSVAYFKRRKS